MLDLTFQELARVVGKNQALEALQIIERSVVPHTDSQKNRNAKVIPLDCDARLKGAFRDMRRANYVALRHAPCMMSETSHRHNSRVRDHSPQPRF